MDAPQTKDLAALRPLSKLLNDEGVAEIQINGTDPVIVERLGRDPEPIDLRLSTSQIEAMVSQLATFSRRVVDLHGGDGRAIISARLATHRVEAILAPVAAFGPYLTIRAHHTRKLSLADYVNNGSMPESAADELRASISRGDSLLVGGSTSSGKTTFLNALLAEINPNHRILTIETILELKVGHWNAVRLEADEEQGYSVRRLLKSALRCTPKWIVIGEARGGEAYDLLDAATTGHPGMATIHANSGLDTLDRMENLVMEGRPELPLLPLRRKIARQFRLIAHMTQTSNGGERFRGLSELLRVDGLDEQGNFQTTPLYRKDLS